MYCVFLNPDEFILLRHYRAAEKPRRNFSEPVINWDQVRSVDSTFSLKPSHSQSPPRIYTIFSPLLYRLESTPAKDVTSSEPNPPACHGSMLNPVYHLVRHAGSLAQTLTHFLTFSLLLSSLVLFVLYWIFFINQVKVQSDIV